MENLISCQNTTANRESRKKKEVSSIYNIQENYNAQEKESPFLPAIIWEKEENTKSDVVWEEKDGKHTEAIYRKKEDKLKEQGQNTAIFSEPKEEKGLKTEEFGKEKENGVQDIFEKAQEQINAVKKAYEKSKPKNLYDATMDLMLIANAEKEAALRVIHSRLLFKIRMFRSTGASQGEIRRATKKVNKVIAKVKVKIKKLKKEEELEKKQKEAEKAKQRKRAQELRRELEYKRKVRKNKEQQDIEESKMGMGANYGGPEELDTMPIQYYDNADAAIDSLLLEGSGSTIDIVSEAGVCDAGAVDAGGIDVLL